MNATRLCSWFCVFVSFKSVYVDGAGQAECYIPYLKVSLMISLIL
jgi:hypothetical protein